MNHPSQPDTRRIHPSCAAQLMRRIALAAIAGSVLTAVASSCHYENTTINQMPGETGTPDPPAVTPDIVPTHLHVLRHTVRSTGIMDVDAGGADDATRASAGAAIRYVVCAFDARGSLIKRSDHLSLSLDDVVDIPVDSLPDGTTIAVWADFTQDIQGSDWFYDTSQLPEVMDLGLGYSAYKECWTGRAVIDYSERSECLVVDMRQPSAAVVFIAVDSRQLAETMPAVDPATCVARIEVNDFVPSSYDLIRCDMVDAFRPRPPEYRVTDDGAGTYKLGSEVYFVKGDSSMLSMNLGVYDKDGRYVAYTRGLDVPVRAGGMTIVRGPFLTTRMIEMPEAGTGIDPGFNGGYEYEIIF